MKTIYKIFEVKDGDGKWFEKYDVSDNFPMEYPYIESAPSLDLINPQYIFGTGWVEDDEAILDSLKKENDALKAKTDSMAQLNAKLMMNDLAMTKDIEALKAQLNPVENVETQTGAE